MLCRERCAPRCSWLPCLLPSWCLGPVREGNPSPERDSPRTAYPALKMICGLGEGAGRGPAGSPLPGAPLPGCPPTRSHCPLQPVLCWAVMLAAGGTQGSRSREKAPVGRPHIREKRPTCEQGGRCKKAVCVRLRNSRGARYRPGLGWLRCVFRHAWRSGSPGALAAGSCAGSSAGLGAGSVMVEKRVRRAGSVSPLPSQDGQSGDRVESWCVRSRFPASPRTSGTTRMGASTGRRISPSSQVGCR